MHYPPTPLLYFFLLPPNLQKKKKIEQGPYGGWFIENQAQQKRGLAVGVKACGGGFYDASVPPSLTLATHLTISLHFPFRGPTAHRVSALPSDTSSVFFSSSSEFAEEEKNRTGTIWWMVHRKSGSAESPQERF